jgi:hypothetical protein
MLVMNGFKAVITSEEKSEGKALNIAAIFF